MQELISELVAGYTQSKFEKKYLQDKIEKILDFIIPEISSLLKNKKKDNVIFLWQSVKEDKKIQDVFNDILQKVERPIVIYVASKFLNNQSIGTKIVEEALSWK